MAKAINRRDFIKSSVQAGVLLGIGGKAFGSGKPSAPAAFDMVIKGGTVVDGLSDKSFRADLGISGEQIQAVGNLQGATGRLTIDAAGRVVSPGFIDIHAHSDAPQVLLNPKCESKIRQGVTTELTGNCGGSSFPLKAEATDEEKEFLARVNLTRDWQNLEGYFARVKKSGVAFNYATLVGQGTIRSLVMNEDRRKPTADELDRMKRLVAEAMEQGAVGLSTGLEYTPSGFASTEEVIELCRVAARYGGFYATHVRNEDHAVVEAIAEAIYIAEAAGLPLQISHLKSCGNTNWWKVPMLIDLVERAQQKGLRVTADRYPYTAYSTGLSIDFPRWAMDGGSEALVKRLRDPELRRKMRDETMEKLEGTSWEDILIVDANKESDKKFIGERISEAAAQAHQDPYEFSCDLIVEEGGNVDIVGFGMSDETTEQVLKHPLVMLCSDGSALAPYGPLHRGMPHPRNYGTFPRFLGLYVREKNIVTLPVAIKKMTSMAAAKLGLKDRGSIKKGNFADLVIFDPLTIADKATYTQPEQYSVGIDYVIVNGTVVIDHGNHTGALPGKILYGPGKK
jgi:N-acyl-D-amino-acid deacylase